MLKLDHLTVIAPTLSEGVVHVENCLGISVPFGTCHEYMGTHNHRLQLGNAVYLEIVAIDPEGKAPDRPRWFGLDNQEKIRSDWDEGRRLRGWVANTDTIDDVVSNHGATLGEKVSLPDENPSFDFAIPKDGSLPLDGISPSVIDHRGDTAFVASIPDLGARLHSLTLEHPDPVRIEALYRKLDIDRPPAVVQGTSTRYRAVIETPSGLRELT